MSDANHYAVCPMCVSFVSKQSRNLSQETALKHNKNAHGGNGVAYHIDVTDTDDLRTFVQDVETLSSGDEYENLLNRMSKGNMPFFVSAKMYQEITE